MPKWMRIWVEESRTYYHDAVVEVPDGVSPETVLQFAEIAFDEHPELFDELDCESEGRGNTKVEPLTEEEKKSWPDDFLKLCERKHVLSRMLRNFTPPPDLGSARIAEQHDVCTSVTYKGKYLNVVRNKNNIQLQLTSKGRSYLDENDWREAEPFDLLTDMLADHLEERLLDLVPNEIYGANAFNGAAFGYPVLTETGLFNHSGEVLSIPTAYVVDCGPPGSSPLEQLVRERKLDMREVEINFKDPKVHLVDVDFDEATGYIGDGTDGVYYQVEEYDDGFYVSAVVDSDTGSFVDSLFMDNGPFSSEEKAMDHAQIEAGAWCYDNDVELTPPEDDEVKVPPFQLDHACPGRDAEPGAPHIFEDGECIFCKAKRKP